MIPTNEEINSMTKLERHQAASRAFHQFVVKENIGRIIVSLVSARQFLEDPGIGAIFSAPLSYHLMILRQRMYAGDFTEQELRDSCEQHLIETGAPDQVRMFMSEAINDFVALGQTS